MRVRLSRDRKGAGPTGTSFRPIQMKNLRNKAGQPFVSALSNLWQKFSRSKKYREAFVSAQLKRGIPAQIRLLLKQRGWSQAELAERSGLTQGAISRAADPDYGNLTLNNILKIAAGFDVAFVGKFVPFSEFAKWQESLSEESLAVVSFESDHIEQPLKYERPEPRKRLG